MFVPEMEYVITDISGKNQSHSQSMKFVGIVEQSKEGSLSQEIKKARLRMEVALKRSRELGLEVCMACLLPTMECKCEGAVAGKIMTVKQWKKEGLGGVRD